MSDTIDTLFIWALVLIPLGGLILLIGVLINRRNVRKGREH